MKNPLLVLAFLIAALFPVQRLHGQGAFISDNVKGGAVESLVAGGVPTGTEIDRDPVRASSDFSLRLRWAHLHAMLIVNAATPGNDLGAKYCWADERLGSTPGEIWIEAGSGTTWTTPCTVHGPRKIMFHDGGSYSIPMGNISFPYATIIDCGGRQQASLNFSGSGTALLFNWNQGGSSSGSFADWGYGIRDCAIYGPGANGLGANAGVGVQIGDPTHTTAGTDIEGCVIAGFALGITWGHVQAWGTRISHTNIVSNTQNFLFSVASPQGEENLLLDHVTFQQWNSGIVVANDFQVTNTGVIDLLCMSCSFDNSQINLGGSAFNSVRFYSRHTETTVPSTVIPILVTAGVVVDIDPLFQWDNPDVCPTAGVSVSGGIYTVYSAVWGGQPSCPIANGIAESGSGIVYQDLPYLRNANTGPSRGAALNAFYGQAVTGIPGCTTVARAGWGCTNLIKIYWPNAFLDTNYTVTCTPIGPPTNVPGAPYVVSKSPASIVVNYFATTSAEASWASIDCQAVKPGTPSYP